MFSAICLFCFVLSDASVLYVLSFCLPVLCLFFSHIETFWLLLVDLQRFILFTAFPGTLLCSSFLICQTEVLSWTSAGDHCVSECLVFFEDLQGLMDAVDRMSILPLWADFCY